MTKRDAKGRILSGPKVAKPYTVVRWPHGLDKPAVTTTVLAFSKREAVAMVKGAK